MQKPVFDKKLNKKKLRKPIVNQPDIKKLTKGEKVAKIISNGGAKDISAWNFLYIMLFFFILFSVLFVSLARLQIVQGEEMEKRSKNNSVRITTIPAYRGIIFDREGNKLVENIPSINVYLNIDVFLSRNLELEEDRLLEVSEILEGVLGEKWRAILDEEDDYHSVYEKIYSVYSANPYLSRVLLARDIDNDTAINIKSHGDELRGVVLEDESKRNYIYPEYFSHVLGYVGEASSEEIDKNDYISNNDIVGKIGIEQYYNRYLAGQNGRLATEINALGHSITDSSYIITPQVSGASLYLTIDLEVQRKVYDILKESVEDRDIKGAAFVIQDVNNGEVLSIVSYPGYNTNLFIGGISQSDYSLLLEDERLPLLNRPISAQIPPASTFKTVVAAAAVDAGAITTSTRYVSRRGYTFSSGQPFREYGDNAYGPLNVVQAIARSSNIFFCEMIRNWRMSELVPYLEAFGVGERMGIDIPGEMRGRLPSPENKIYLAEHGSFWLDPVWYPEGDSCHSVVGQGITLATPLQMSSWTAAIANGGTLHTPHVAREIVRDGEDVKDLEFNPLRANIVSDKALDVVRQGMWSAVYGGVGTGGRLSTLPKEIAIKTGTAEFGTINRDGRYEHTHAWITGFYPYEEPKYSFSLFFEDSKDPSFRFLPEAYEILSWLMENGYY